MNGTPPDLAALQECLQRYLLEGVDGILDHVEEPGIEPAQRRLAIYGDAYFLRLVEVLATDYRVLAALLGERQFDQLGRVYARAHPSRHRSVRWFGAHLADFVAANAPWNTRAELAEIATFEWALSLTFDARDQQPVGFDSVAAVAPGDWPGLVTQWHPSCTRLDLRSNAPRLRVALEAEEALPALELAEHARAWLLWRHEDTPRFRSLEVDEAWAVDAARSGAGFGELCEGLLEWRDPEHVAMHAASLLKTWVGDGLITGLQTGNC